MMRAAAGRSCPPTPHSTGIDITKPGSQGEQTYMVWQRYGMAQNHTLQAPHPCLHMRTHPC